MRLSHKIELTTVMAALRREAEQRARERVRAEMEVFRREWAGLWSPDPNVRFRTRMQYGQYSDAMQGRPFQRELWLRSAQEAEALESERTSETPIQ